MVVTSATTTRKHISIRWVRTPRASATSGITDAKRSGRYKITTAAMHTTPSTAVASTWLVLTPSTSPKRSA